MDKVLKILHLEDSPSDAKLVRRVLKKGALNFESVVVDTKAEFLKALERFSPDIILSDHSLPSFNSHEALSIIRQNGIKIPFILITGNVSEEFAVDVIKKGADDYILKDRLERLPVAIDNALERYRFERERQLFINDVIKNEKRYRALIENGSDGMAILSAEGKPLYVSPNMKNVLGYTDEESMHLDLFNIEHPEDTSTFINILAKSVANPGIPCKGNPFRMLHKDGQWIWVEGILTNMLHDPSINGIVDNFRDITERIQAEQIVKESEEKYRSFYENSMDGILLTVTDGEILAANPAACEIFQMTEQEICNAGRLGLVDTSDPRVAQGIKERQLTGKAKVEITCKRKDGSKFPGELTSAVFQDAAGNQRTSMIIRDISERKVAEQLILESELQYRSLIQDLPVAVYTTDQKGKIKIYNKAAVELWGREPEAEDLWCGSWRIFKNDGTSLPLDECPMAIALNEGRNVYGEEIIIERPDRSMRNISPFPTTKLNNAGELIGAVNMLIDTTERKKNEQEILRTTNELQKSEQQYRQIVETAQEGIWLVDQDDKTIFVNSKLCQFLGYNKEEMIGKQPYFFMDEEGKRIAEKSLREKRSGINTQEDFKYISKSGKEVWASVSANPIFDAEGSYDGALSMVADITDKKALERLLNKASSLSRIGSYEADLVNKVLFWSPMIKEIHEVEDDFIPKIETAINFYKVGLNRETVTKAYLELIEKNIPFDRELQIITAKGNERWVRVICEAEFYKGVCCRLYGSFQDIDKIKKAEFEALKAYEEKNVILESIGDAFFAVDLNWVVTYWNKEAEKLLECSRNQIIGKNIWEVFEKTDNTSFYSYYQKALKKNTIQHFEAYYEKTACWIEVTAYPSPNGLSVYFKDITERKLSDMQLIELNRDLHKYTQQLVISNTELEQFSYIISHNLRAPVANIMGLTEEFKDESHTAETKEMLNTALSSSVKVLNDVIIDLNTILNAKKEISERKETVSLSDLITDIQLNFQKEIQAENVQIIKEFNEINQILTLKSYLHSIFFNLISNSIKYRQSGIPPVIYIKSVRCDKELTIIFKDNGMGIDMVRRKNQVFGLYKRFHQHTEGKGMGLFMVKTQVETLGGKITINSEVNKGTEFKITFPLEQ